MIIDGRGIPADSTVDMDVCVIGSGAAGISLALEFVNQPGIVVGLVESGGREWDERTQALSEASQKGHRYYPVKETHMRVLGGTTLAYGGICTEMSSLDFEERPWVPESGWPLQRSDLYDYSDRSHDLLGLDGDTEELTHWESTEATRWENVLVSRPPTLFGQKYAQQLDSSTNVTTYIHSTVASVDLHADGGHVAGVSLRCIGGNRYRIVAKQYVLAGGGIEIPRLLLASNDVATAGVGNLHDHVGRYFQEHLRAIDRYEIAKGAKNLTDKITGASGTLKFSRLALTDEVLRKEKLLNYLANLTFGFSGQDTPQWEAIRRIAIAKKPPWNVKPYAPYVSGGPNKVRWQDVKTSLARPHRTAQAAIGAGLRPKFMRKWVEVGSSMEQVPRPENRVVLVAERDELGMPKVELNWSLDDFEGQTYHRGLELVLEELDRHLPGLNKRRMNDPEQWPDHILGTWHHAGTTRMTSDPKRGVVDANTRVHGVDNLFIASSSVFPTSGATAPTKSIVCLALRLADHLKSIL